MDEGVVKCHKDVTSEETLDVVANEITEPEVTDTDDELEDQWPYTYPDAITATKIKIIEPDQIKKEEQEEQDQGPKEEQEEQVREEEAATTAEEEESVAEASAQPRQQTTFKLRGRWRRSLAKIMRR
jgi:hypothetical protein